MQKWCYCWGLGGMGESKKITHEMPSYGNCWQMLVPLQIAEGKRKRNNLKKKLDLNSHRVQKKQSHSHTADDIIPIRESNQRNSQSQEPVLPYKYQSEKLSIYVFIVTIVRNNYIFEFSTQTSWLGWSWSYSESQIETSQFDNIWLWHTHNIHFSK